ncbi:MAG: FAD-binding protein [Firmicutes bacterium]|nr:FAD-binding protein [Bacillota bacterium]
MEQYDLVIAGAGPAGSILAKTVGKKFRVLMVEMRNVHAPLGTTREKSCGGMLNTSAQKVLASFGMPLPKEVLQSPQVFTVRAIDYDNHDERYYQKQYVNIDRETFDRWLLAEALMEDGVEIVDNTKVIGFTPHPDYVDVQLRKENGETESVRTRYFVGADGGGSLVRRHLEEKFSGPDEPKYPIQRYVSLQQWFEVEEDLPYYVALFDQKVTDYYSWMIPKNGQVILGAAIPEGKDVRKRFEHLKKRANQSGFNLGEPVKERGAILLRPYGPMSVNLGKGRVFLAGEAAGLISSSSEEGISYAMSSGRELGEALLEGKTPADVEAKYRKGVRHKKWGLAVKSLKAIVMYNPVLRGLVFKTGLLSMDVK